MCPFIMFVGLKDGFYACIYSCGTLKKMNYPRYMFRKVPRILSSFRNFLQMSSVSSAKKPYVYFNAIHELHAGPIHHPESPERVAAILRALQPCIQRKEIVLREFSAAVERRPEGGRRIRHWRLKDGDTYATAFTPSILAISREMIQSAVNDLLSGETRCAFVFCRPPGHHATADTPAGFCHQNNVWAAVELLRAAGSGRNISVYDWDAHHGDGTEALVENDTGSGIRFCSSHAFGEGVYPGTGAAKRTERVFNIPLAVGTDGKTHLAKFHADILPFLTKPVRPDLLILSAGYDGHRADPMELLAFDTETYNEMAKVLHALGIPTLFLLEGGYNPTALAECVVATLEPWVVAAGVCA